MEFMINFINGFVFFVQLDSLNLTDYNFQNSYAKITQITPKGQTT